MTGMSLVALVAGSAPAWAGTNPLVPESLRTPATEVLSRETKASGVQIYECSASKDEPARIEWTFKAPEADLFDRAGNKIGKHHAGPTWESNDLHRRIRGRGISRQGVFLLVEAATGCPISEAISLVIFPSRILKM